MKDKILLTLLVSTILASCSSVYRSGQTPDDVYYSPTREVAKVEEKEEEKIEEKSTASEDQYIRMKVRDRYRWTKIDDYEYWNDTRYNTSCYCTCNPPSYGYNYYPNYYNPIRYNSWYNPYAPVLVYGNTKNIKGTTTASNVKAYNTRTYNNTNSTTNVKTGTTNNQGSLLKRVFTSSGTSVDRSERTFSGSGSTTTSSSAGGKSGGMNTTGSGSKSGKSRGN
jgi:hypothetical protein